MIILLFKIALYALIIGLFFYSRIIPHHQSLSGFYKKYFSLLEVIFKPTLGFLRRFFKPKQIGQNIHIDTAEMVFLIVLMLILE